MAQNPAAHSHAHSLALKPQAVLTGAGASDRRGERIRPGRGVTGRSSVVAVRPLMDSAVLERMVDAVASLRASSSQPQLCSSACTIKTALMGVDGAYQHAVTDVRTVSTGRTDRHNAADCSTTRDYKPETCKNNPVTSK